MVGSTVSRRRSEKNSAGEKAPGSSPHSLPPSVGLLHASDGGARLVRVGKLAKADLRFRHGATPRVSDALIQLLALIDIWHQHAVNEPVLDRLLGGQVEVAPEIFPDLFDGLLGVLRPLLLDPGALPDHLPRLDLDIGRLALERALEASIGHQKEHVGCGEAPARRACRHQKGTHARAEGVAHRRDLAALALELTHRVVERQGGLQGRTRCREVDLDGLRRILALQVQ
mmetsp:Transcript_46855/g.121978  ORF Transcript_46855/g.121978 Transcript_46855/m.121978 type:complete len:228 (+) Transcript_46855:2-685(+)